MVKLNEKQMKEKVEKSVHMDLKNPREINWLKIKNSNDLIRNSEKTRRKQFLFFSAF